MLNEELVIKVLAAIKLRNDCSSGLRDVTWIHEQIIALIEIGFWNDSQVAEIVGYSRQRVSEIARESAVRPAKALQAGRLNAGALDGILELQGAVRGGRQPNAKVLQSVIRTGTSTRLIHALTEIPMGSILYNQRKLRKENHEANSMSDV